MPAGLALQDVVFCGQNTFPAFLESLPTAEKVPPPNHIDEVIRLTSHGFCSFGRKRRVWRVVWVWF